MSEHKHTPGPWKAKNEYDCIRAGNRCVVCMGHDYDDGGVIPNDADMTLITAAPDMLAALNSVMKLDEMIECFSGNEHVRAEVLAAIAKAEGE